MEKIDEIYDMLDWNNSIDIQEKGRRLANEIGSIDKFLQPINDKHDKNVWGNCARILSGKTDEELGPYLMELFEWLQDLNWPGAICILERIANYKAGGYNDAFEASLKQAKSSEDEIWLDNLLHLEAKRNNG